MKYISYTWQKNDVSYWLDWGTDQKTQKETAGTLVQQFYGNISGNIYKNT